MRGHGDEVIITAVTDDGPEEVVRHQRGAPGNPQYVDEHFGPAPEGPLHRTPKPRPRPSASSWPGRRGRAVADRGRAQPGRGGPG